MKRLPSSEIFIYRGNITNFYSVAHFRQLYIYIRNIFSMVINKSKKRKISTEDHERNCDVDVDKQKEKNINTKRSCQ